ncbi:MAG: substrate-binding domain-containing protein [Lachnospiraceae bacterium]|jgi:phosphate transport system substrate-binding protein|nr:substrate-binding domain-containing protein [Lachnospiraceae bacterium]
MSVILLLVLFIFPLGLLSYGIATKKKLIIKGACTLFTVFLFLIFFIISLISGDSWFWPYFGNKSTWLIPIALAGLLYIIICLIWGYYKTKAQKIVLILFAFAFVVYVTAIGGYIGYQSSILVVKEADSEIPLYDFAPFAENTLAASLDEESNLKFTDNLPRLDGATALYPLYASFARAVYPYGDPDTTYFTYDDANYPATENSDEERALVICSSTSMAFENLVNGSIDIAFLMGVSEEQQKIADNKGLTLKLTPIGKEGFIFIVNSKNKITNLTVDEIKGIYSGKITDWGSVGDGTYKGTIDVYQRPEGSGSQTALEKIMGDTQIIPAKEEEIYEFMRGLYIAVSDYKNYKTSIGYSFRYYIETMLNDKEKNKVTLLSINGIAPTVENIANGTYPFADTFYAVTIENREPTSEAEKKRLENAELLLEWVQGEQGQELVGKTGYVRVND